MKTATKTPKPHERRGASEAGFHFWSLFQNCKRKFYIRHRLGLVPLWTKRELLFGAAFHDAKAVFYTSPAPARRAFNTPAWDKAMQRAKDAAPQEILDSLRSRAGEYADPEILAKDLYRGPILLERWINEFGLQDRRIFEIVAVEQELEGRLPNGFRVTGRLDCLFRDPQGLYYILETKTSSFSITLTLRNLEMGDQPTTYLWLVKQAFPKLRVSGLIPDIAYWNKEAKSPSNINCFRGDIITRSEQDLQDFELYTMDTLEDIARRMQATEAGTVPAIMAFGRNTDHCFSYHTRCEYADICRTRIRSVPDGFYVDKQPTAEARSILPLASTRFDLAAYARRSSGTKSAEGLPPVARAEHAGRGRKPVAKRAAKAESGTKLDLDPDHEHRRQRGAAAVRAKRSKR